MPNTHNATLIMKSLVQFEVAVFCSQTCKCTLQKLTNLIRSSTPQRFEVSIMLYLNVSTEDNIHRIQKQAEWS